MRMSMGNGGFRESYHQKKMKKKQKEAEKAVSIVPAIAVTLTLQIRKSLERKKEAEQKMKEHIILLRDGGCSKAQCMDAINDIMRYYYLEEITGGCSDFGAILEMYKKIKEKL
jgi:hypothetical protein